MADPGQAEDLEFLKCLGKGFFGEVYSARETGGAKRVFAVKKVKLSLISENRLTDQLQREVNLLYTLQHPRIVRLYFDFKDSNHMYLGMEMATAGSLFDRLNKTRKFPPETASRYFAEVCDALDYLHHRPEKVVHRDIKPENILLDFEDHIKLADFGWANMLQGSLRETFCGTLDYLAPEMITGTGHDESVDMWNMGVLLYELTTGQSPFGSPNKETTCRLILNVDLHFPIEIDVDAKDLVVSLCKKKTQDRLDVRTALSHQFVTKFRGGAVVVDHVMAEDSGDVDDVMARPSVLARSLRKDHEKLSAEMQQLLQSKQKTEDDMMKINADLEMTHSSLKKEQKLKMKFTGECEEMRRKSVERLREIEELRKRADNLKAQIAKNVGKSDATKLSFWQRGSRN